MPSIHYAPPDVKTESPDVLRALDQARPPRPFSHYRCDECGGWFGQVFDAPDGSTHQVCGLDWRRLEARRERGW